MTLKQSLRCGAAVTCLALLAAGLTAAEQLPSPGVGVFITAGQTAALREKIRRPPCQALYQAILKDADASLARWPADRERLHQIAPKLLDLTMEAVPAAYAPEGGKEASKLLEQYAVRGAPNAAFVYLMTGDRRYADFAWDVFTACAKTGRWGWFPWDGSHMPQIHYGTISRNMVLVADCASDALTPAQRQQAREVIAEKVVEPYFRIVLHTPGMGLYHLRSVNQGNNALGAAVAGSVFVGDAVPDNRLWQRSLVQTLHWAITHDIGWMGQRLESGIGGYWSISVQNLYTAAAALANVRGIDLRCHPGFDQATYYPIIHEVTVPPVGPFRDPIPTDADPQVMGIIAGKPVELPAASVTCGPWWFDFAMRAPESPAMYFIRKPLLDELAAERNALVKAGRKNLALGAKVTASATRDPRFPPEKVIDNQTAEYPADGRLDYTLGITWSSNRTAGYGQGRDSLLANRDAFPLYVRPTYWLLPEETPGWVELELAAPATVSLVRLLNTSNAGMNDFAAHAVRVELFDPSRKLLAARDVMFGKAFDRPFKQAFAEPKWFSRYTRTFEGMLDPGLTVPFGDGWKEVAFDAAKDAAYVRVTITKYWGIGGGLNEVQVYGK